MPSNMEDIKAALGAIPGQKGQEKVKQSKEPPAKRSGIKILQCNDELCQYEVRPDGEIEWAAHSKRLINLTWDTPPKVVLVIKKPNSPEVTEVMKEVVTYMHKTLGLTVLVEPAVKVECPDVDFLVALTPMPPNRSCTTQQARESEAGEAAGGGKGVGGASAGKGAWTLCNADFVVCLGGDGTILWVSGLYNGPCPPIVSFAMGSLGFLTPFDFSEYQSVLSSVVTSSMEIGVRMRLQCRVLSERNNLEGDFLVLNEVSVDRGPSPYLTNVECFCDDRYVTMCEGDGIIVATPTGSTAYSLAAGGSMVHPDVPGMLLTPICVHSLAFRPSVFPDSVTRRLQVPDDSRVAAWCNFDGRNAMPLKKGWCVSVTASKWPIPIVTRTGMDYDWFNGVTECLNWNNRKAQNSGFQRPNSGADAPPPVAKEKHGESKRG